MDLEQKLKEKTSDDRRLKAKLKSETKKRKANAKAEQARVSKSVRKFGLIPIVTDEAFPSIKLYKPGKRWIDYVGSIDPSHSQKAIDRTIEELVLKHGETPSFMTTPLMLFLRNIFNRL